MKRVLIIAYDYPPNKSIGGARPESWIAHFPKFGVKPFLVSRIWDGSLESDVSLVKPSERQEVEVVKNDDYELRFVPFKPVLRDEFLIKYGNNKYSSIRKVFTLYHKLFDFQILPPVFKAIKNEAQKVVNENKIDIILVTGEPFLLFKVAKDLSKTNNIPWIADYRDCWTSERVKVNSGGVDRFLLDHFFSKIENSVVNTATLITTPAPSYQKDLKSVFPNKRVETIFNGYFEEKVSDEILRQNQETEVLTIAYIGILYPHQKLELFLQAMDSVVARTPQKIKVIFIGLDFYPDQKKRVLDFKSKGTLDVEFTPKLPYDIMIHELKKINICLLLSSKGADWLNTKIFDYLLVNREVLLVENDEGILSHILSETNSGIAISTLNEIEAYLERKLIEFKENGKVIEPAKSKGFSRLNQSEKLCELIKEL